MRFYDKEGEVCENLADRIVTNIGISIERVDKKRRENIIESVMRDMEPDIRACAEGNFDENVLIDHLATMIDKVNRRNDGNILYDGAQMYKEAMKSFRYRVSTLRKIREINGGT